MRNTSELSRLILLLFGELIVDEEGKLQRYRGTGRSYYESTDNADEFEIEGYDGTILHYWNMMARFRIYLCFQNRSKKGKKKAE
jgi:hypothetical protein